MRKKHTESQLAQRLLPTLLCGERGADLAEYSLFLCLMILLLGGLVYGASKAPNFLDKSLLVAVFSAIVGAIAWGAKQAIETLHLRAKLLILELLSDGGAYNRDEIGSFLKREGLTFRVMPLHLDAIADLLLAGKIVLNNGKYEILAKPKRKILTLSNIDE